MKTILLDKNTIEAIEAIIKTRDECIVKVERDEIVVLQSTRRLKAKNKIQNGESNEAFGTVNKH